MRYRDADAARVQVQNKLQLAMPLLPREVQQRDVSVEKSSSRFLMVVGVSLTPTTRPGEDISDYVAANMKDRQPYVPLGWATSSCLVACWEYAIWMNPTRADQIPTDMVDVINAIRSAERQSQQVSARWYAPPVKASSLTHRLLPKRVDLNG